MRRYSIYTNVSFPLFNSLLYIFLNEHLVSKNSIKPVFYFTNSYIYRQQSIRTARWVFQNYSCDLQCSNRSWQINIGYILNIFRSFSYLFYYWFHSFKFLYRSGSSHFWIIVFSFHDLLIIVCSEVFFKTRAELIVTWKSIFIYIFQNCYFPSYRILSRTFLEFKLADAPVLYLNFSLIQLCFDINRFVVSCSILSIYSFNMVFCNSRNLTYTFQMVSNILRMFINMKFYQV